MRNKYTMCNDNLAIYTGYQYRVDKRHSHVLLTIHLQRQSHGSNTLIPQCLPIDPAHIAVQWPQWETGVSQQMLLCVCRHFY